MGPGTQARSAVRHVAVPLAGCRNSCGQIARAADRGKRRPRPADLAPGNALGRSQNGPGAAGSAGGWHFRPPDRSGNPRMAAHQRVGARRHRGSAQLGNARSPSRRPRQAAADTAPQGRQQGERHGGHRPDRCRSTQARLLREHAARARQVGRADQDRVPALRHRHAARDLQLPRQYRGREPRPDPHDRKPQLQRRRLAEDLRPPPDKRSRRTAARAQTRRTRAVARAAGGTGQFALWRRMGAAQSRQYRTRRWLAVPRLRAQADHRAPQLHRVRQLHRHGDREDPRLPAHA